MKRWVILANNYTYIIGFLIFFTVLPSSAYAEKKETIFWAVNDAQPFYITQGERKGQGFGDRIQTMIISRMSDYHHVILNRPLKRALQEMKNDEPRCFSTWIYKTRADIVVTSAPYLYYQPHGVVLLKETQEKLSNPDTLSFDKLLQAKEYTFGKPLGRGYGEQLDPILEKHKGAKHISRGAGRSTEGIFKMLQAGRIDYTIEYPHTMHYYADKLGMKDTLIFIPIEENRHSGLLGAVACTKTNWGQAVIKDINQAIGQIRELPEYKKILHDWFIIQGKEEAYWEIYQKEVLPHLE